MDISELAGHSAYIVTEYYKNNIRPFLDSFARDCLWIGPAQGQMIRTRKALHAAFAAEDNRLTFDVYDLEVIPISVSRDSLDVVCVYTVVSHYPNGDRTVFRQRTELLWALEAFVDDEGNKGRNFFIRVCHISNEYPYAADDRIYPNHFNELDIAKLYAPAVEAGDARRLSLRGKGNSFSYLSASSVLWASCKHGYTVIHTPGKDYESTESIGVIVERYPDVLFRIHASHAVNPLAVTGIGRFYVTLSDGTRLPIPEKRYTKIKAELNRLIERLRERR